MGMRDLKTARKLGLAFALLVVAAGCIGAVVHQQVVTVEKAGRASEVHGRIVAAATDIRLSMARLESSVRGLLVSRDKRYIDSIEKHYASLLKNVDITRKTAESDSEVAAKMKIMLDHVGTWRLKVLEPVMGKALKEKTFAQAVDIAMSDTADSYIDPAQTIIEELRAAEHTAMDNAADEVAKANFATKVTLGAGIGFLIFASVLLGWLLNRLIGKPILAMTNLMLKLAGGDTDIALDRYNRSDEIGAMARAVGVFRDAVDENRRLEADAVSARRVQEEQRTRQLAVDNVRQQGLRGFVDAVQFCFTELSNGDLTIRMKEHVAPEFETIRDKFNDTVAAMEQAIGSVVASVGTIRAGLAQISDASNDLAKRTEEQAANLEETVAALSDASRGVDDAAIGAGRAQEFATTAQENARRGGEIVTMAVEAMTAIESSSNQIGMIIGVIDEIAFQTNLLALNAGVEAARAGDAGRGFAVVAQEVRGLAQRSAEAAKEIKDLISTSSRQVDEGVKLVRASGTSLCEIVVQVSDVNGVVSQIARTSREQATSLKEVSVAADLMDKVTQQNAAMVEETTAAARSLARETDDLARQVQRFRTGSTASPGEMAQEMRRVA
ncbi:Methyl-accepting chemotaxis protein IV [Ensifer adhaerens]|nr:Methyl-accepting chemotaxis protein IV [Ensifer adhaerens]